MKNTEECKKTHISNSQISVYMGCPYRYYLKYIKKIELRTSNIFAIFGTAMHEAIQEYLKVLFDDSAKKADRLDLEDLLQDYMIRIYKTEQIKTGIENICTLDEIKDFYVDGVEIIKYFKKKRLKYFSTRKYELLAIEEKLDIPLEINPNINFQGALDVVLREKKGSRIKIIDIKTSYNGWKDKKKKNILTRAQLVLYKKYYAKKYDIDINKIDIEFFILKRKVSDNYDWPIPRIQKFSPPSSQRTINRYSNLITELVENVFDENGNRIIKKDYPKKKSAANCKYCEYKKTKYCDKWK